jgi:hypothetical protein
MNAFAGFRAWSDTARIVAGFQFTSLKLKLLFDRTNCTCAALRFLGILRVTIH